MLSILWKKLDGTQIPLDILVDSKTVFNTVTKGATTLEKRLQIDASAIQQSRKTGGNKNDGMDTGIQQSGGWTDT